MPQLGKIDAYGNYFIQMPHHHVTLDERSFFSKYLWVDKNKSEKEARVEAFRKLIIALYSIVNIKTLIEEIS
jgi:hypothetical protein